MQIECLFINKNYNLSRAPWSRRFIIFLSLHISLKVGAIPLFFTLKDEVTCPKVLR